MLHQSSIIWHKSNKGTTMPHASSTNSLQSKEVKKKTLALDIMSRNISGGFGKK